MATAPARERDAAPEAAVDGKNAGKRRAPERVTFPDLVRAHRSWEQELYGTALYDRKPDRRLEQEFHRRWDQFEGKYGQIHTVYWSVRDASAVAFSIKDKPEALPAR